MNCIDDELLKKYNRIWNKVTNSIKTGFFFSELVVYNEKYLRTNIESFEGKINTNFH